ncbi:MAG: hypothetical protein Q620_VSAC00269G0006 [Veillonella sp. DORA_A_3_16_22]|nr:MAG: hypothetical protein Q620_VSAC00269G0006 [Veillonella sp. DORA_A_3_16_22]
MYERTKNFECELMFLDSPLGLKISVVLIVKSMRSERCIYETTTQMRSFYYFVFGIGSPMSVVKPLLWLLEPYIVYKAYLWALRFIAHPVTWEGEIDLFSLTLTVLLILDAVVLPLVILYCPGLNHGKRVPDWIRRLGTPIYIVHNWLDGKVGGGTSTPIVWLRRTLHSLLLFIYLLIPLYVGGHLVMGLVVALMYDVLVWAHGGV